MRINATISVDRVPLVIANQAKVRLYLGTADKEVVVEISRPNATVLAATLAKALDGPKVPGDNWRGGGVR